MRIKKLLPIGLVALLLLSMAAIIVPVSALKANQIWVEPWFTDCLYQSSTFKVSVKLNVTAGGLNPGATGLFAFEYKLKWNATHLSCTSYSVLTLDGKIINWGKPPALAPPFVSETMSPGQHWYAVVAMANATPYLGPVLTLANYTFHVDYQPYSPFESDINATLDLADVKLGDNTGKTILPWTDILDGYYYIHSIPVLPPKLKTAPVKTYGDWGQKFNITLEIVNLHPGFRLHGWQVTITYNTTMLDALNSWEGPFMKAFMGPNGTWYINLIDDPAGTVLEADTFLDGHNPASGSGVLGIIEFNATWQYTSPPLYPDGPGTFCYFDLINVTLLDCDVKPINFTIIGTGKYNAPFKTLGWSLDCWTDPYRKKCITPFTGKLPQVNADAYEPQDLVILYSRLVYNEYPEQNKIVMFEIYGPTNPYHNISIIRTAITNSSGVATINFTIPWPCEHAREITFGKWKCFQKAQVKFGLPNDTLWFEVGWIVELLSASVSPQPVHPCQNLVINATFKNIMLIPKNVTFTFVIYDELLDPLGEFVIRVEVPEGTWCHPEPGFIIGSIHIPKWCHVGPGARVYINAFTDLPTKCGCPYCPEISVGFTIAA